MPLIDPAFKELMRYGLVGALLLLSLGFNVYLYRLMQACQREKIKLLRQWQEAQISMMEDHETAITALYERTAASREKLLEKYQDFVRQSDKTLSDLMTMFRARLGGS